MLAAASAGALVVVGIVGWIVVARSRRGADPLAGIVPAKQSGPAAPQGGGAPATAKPAGPDPDRDPAAWRALPAADRLARARKALDSIDRKSESALWWSYGFFKAREEADALRQVCLWEIEREPSTPWAREGLGHEDIREKVEKSVLECAMADEMDVPAIRALEAYRKKHEPSKGKWWADAATRTEIDGLLAELRKAEEELKDPYRHALAKWRIWQSRVEVMRDYPAVSEAVGPYLLFVQIQAPAGTPLDQVARAERQRAERVLRHNVELFGAFHDFWAKDIATALGVKVYGPSNADEKSLLKANIFADETTWVRYHAHRRLSSWIEGVRAYYESDEPRFIVSHDGSAREDPAYTDYVHCYAATLQLLHFHTWDRTREATGKEPPWADCARAPLWSSVGFAECVASHSREGKRFRWMEPLDRRLKEVWTYADAMARRKWSGIGLAELIEVPSRDALEEHAARRITKKDREDWTENDTAWVRWLTPHVARLFHARAWSFVHFLWFAKGPDGNPKYRDLYIAFLRRQLTVRYDYDPARRLVPRALGPDEFRRDFGIEDPARFREFEAEWTAFEAALIAARRRPAWDAARTELLEAFGAK